MREAAENGELDALIGQQREFVRLNDTRLEMILKAKYHTSPDAQRQLGTINEIRTTFIDFQQHLYSAAVG